ncbi:iron complex outermembrane recepter protein [Hymenobacter daecheongensis DSM 21074]|uniref:Iron complex outermembrane recepter protein n=1 Tax=Hymenobacter daecheongensis DSM 21074 TaxID=1121955 RepID=A0A1M6ERQ2_9BACT|nr:SusC/RagA family TonB-linked outer membrane protein [Hymenobacter daecheongensis]SHI88103.1 iron complex outermembrane recepter protein [Hymenobacter daecheongensis DSM 21074]
MKHHYLAKLLFLLLFVCAGFTSAFAQTGSVSGRVLDEKKEGVPGATVIIDGSTLGSSTNTDGTYNIQNVPAGPHTLVISYVGYNTSRQNINVTAGQNTAVAEISLAENTTLLSEAVVVGYGTQRRQDLTGAVEQVTSKQFVKGQVTNPEQLVQGKVAGIQITTNGGAPGAGSQILIRGGSSLSASNQPLIVIDGVPVDNTGIAGTGNPLTLINPNDIESITVLKDASSTAIYGVRASNGVIIVTTKKGVQGEELRVNFATQQSIATVAKYVPVLTADEFRALVNRAGNDQQKGLLGTANTDWQKEIYRNAFTSDNNLSVLGSAGKVPFRVSTGYLTQQGLLKNNDLKRYSGSVGITPMLLNDNLRVDLNVKGTWIDNNFSDQGAVGNAVSFDPTQPIRSDDPKYAPFGGYYEAFGTDGSLNTLSPRNPVSLINQRRDRSTVKRSIGNVMLDYKLPFLTGLSANLNLGYDVQRGAGTTFVPTSAASAFNRQGVNNNYRQDLNNTILETYAKYQGDVLGQRFDILGGYSFQKFQNRQYRFDDRREDGSVFTPFSRTFDDKDQTLDTRVLLSYYSRANYNIKDRYLFTGTFRIDQTSNFAKGQRTGYFPSGAFAWRVKGEDFLKSSTAVSDLKLRLGVGQTGQQDIGNNSSYLPVSTLSTNTSQYQFGFDGAGNPLFYPTLRPGFYNPGLTWETTTTYNAGLDFGFLDSRITGSVDVYQRDTKDLLFFSNVAALSNTTNAGFLNVGSLTNKGVEFTTNLEAVRGEKFGLTLNANATFNRNRITKLTIVDSPDFIGQETGGIAGGVGNNAQINSVGYAAGSFYLYKQLYNSEGRPIQNAVADLKADGTINGSDRYRYKSSRPDAVLGFGANTTYGKASLAFTMRSNIGQYVYNNVRSQSAFTPNATNFLNNVSDEQLSSGFNSTATQVLLSDYFLENASFLRMENVTLGYNIGNALSEKANINVSFAVQNLFLITKYKGLDPEVSSGIDNTIYPRPRTYTLGLNFGF